MKGPRKPRRSHVPFVVYTSEGLGMRPHEDVSERAATEKPFEIGPSLLLITRSVKWFSVIADTLTDSFAIQFIILGAIYADIAVLTDDFELSQLGLMHQIMEQIKTVIGAEDSIRISVEVVLGWYLPYECPQRHAPVSGDVCSDCGVRIGTLGEHLFPLPEAVETAVVDDAIVPRIRRASKSNRKIRRA